MLTTRVLVVYQHLPHYRYGVFKSLEELPNATYEFAAACKSRDGSIPTIPLGRLNVFYPLRNLWFGRLLWQRGLTAIVLQRRYDAVIFLGDVAYMSTWVAAILARFRGQAVVFWTIGWHRRESGVVKHLRLAFYALADKLLLYGSVARGIGVDLGYPPDKMVQIGNSHEPPPSPDRLPLAALEAFSKGLPPSSTRVIGAVVRLNAAKRLDLLMMAAAVLKDRGKSVVVLLVGSGPERERLQSLATQLEVEVAFAGAAYGEEQIELVYDLLTVTVVPVNAGLTALQSMRYGRPVITNDNPYHQAPESECIIAGQTGDYYKDDSVDDLADKIDCWLERMQISEDEIAKRCRTEVRTRWSANAQAGTIHREILSAIEKLSV